MTTLGRNVSRRHLIGAMAAMPLMAGGCSILSAGGKDDQPLRINYGGSADVNPPPSPNVIEENLTKIVGFDTRYERSPEDIGAALAAGQAPDIFYSSRGQLRQFDGQQLLLDLNPYRDRLADYEAFVTTEHVETGIIDDRLIGVVRKPREFSYGGMWIRGDWLDKLGLDTPKTLDEFTDALTAFRDEKPGRSDAVPMTGSGMGSFDMIFGAYETCSPGALYSSAGEIVDGYSDPANREPIEYLSNWFAENLVDPDLFSVETGEARDRALQGSAGAIYVGWNEMTKPEFVEAGKSAQPDAEWRMIDVLSTDGKDGGMPTDPYGAVQGVPADLADDEDRLDALLKYLNYLGTDEGSRLVMFGIEGTHYNLENDTVEPLPAMDEEGSYFFAYQAAGRDEDSYLDVKFDAQREYWEACRDRKRITRYEALVAPPEGFSTSDATRFGEEQLVLFLTGERKLTEYDTFLEDMESQFDFSSYVASAREQLAKLGLPE